MKKFFVIDVSNIKSKRYKNQAGFLVLPDCVIARSGILEYSDVQGEDGKVIADGNLIAVLRPKEALKKCYKNFSNLPLSCQHPNGNQISPDNVREVIVGALGSNPRYEVREDGEGYIVCDIVVYDADIIQKIEDGEFQELSAGYETAFRRKRGTTTDGHAYEAEQYYLSPNHVALVEQGRCGSQCRICDHAENIQKGERKMSRRARDAKKKFRWFLSIGDGKALELTEDQVEALKRENPEVDEEEVDPDDLEDIGVAGIEEDEDEEVDPDDEEDLEIEDKKPAKKDKAPAKSKKDEDEEVDPDEDEDEDLETDEDEEEVDPDDEEEVETEKDEKSDLTYEVQFEDGTIGKMDENAYKQVQRFLDMTKKGDEMERGFAEVTVLASHAAKILGDRFDVANYVADGRVNTAKIKREVIRKVLPNIVLTNLKGDSLDRVFETAVETAKKSKSAWQRDLLGLEEASKVRKGDKNEEALSPAQAARQLYLNRQRGIKPETK